jgi:putative transcriptional regulator
MERSWRCIAMGRQYRSDALAAVHETAQGLAEAGVLSRQTMRTFDEMCLTPVAELSAGDIREIRLRERASQAVFARYLNVTPGLVSQWERGEKRPRGASLKLLTLVARKGLRTVA